jgi:CspA family cold shock protein
MLSNIFARLLTSVRPMNNYQQHFLRLLSTTEPISTENVSGNRETGVVKRFSKEKGYGFISKTSDGTDYFVQYVGFYYLKFYLLNLFVLSFKNINASGFKTLDQGQEVEFTIVQGEKGLEAKVS